MKLPLAIAEGILIALGAIWLGYVVLKWMPLVWLFSSGVLQQIWIEHRLSRRPMLALRISRFRRYRTEAGKRQLKSEFRIFCYMVLAVVLWLVGGYLFLMHRH